MLPRRPAPDELAVAHWLERTAPEGDATLYAGVRRLRPGQRLALGDPGATPEPWWPPPWSAPAALAPGEVEEALRAGMRHAVERALAGARSPGVLLSGGFDSAAVAALAGDAHAYSMTFPAHPEIDESARIDRVVEHAGLPATRLEFAGGSALATAREDLAAWELPPASPNRFVWAPLLRRARDDGAGVLLGGDGGDELFGVSPYLIADRLRHGRALSALDLARRLPGMGDRPPARLVRRALFQYGARGGLAPGLHARLRRARQRGTPAHDPWAWKRRPGPRWHAWLAHTLTTGADALGAPDHFRHEATLAGIAVRHPWRDPDLVAAVLALPPEAAFDAHLDRPAARRAMAGLVPDEVRLDDRKPHFNRLLEESLERDRAPARALLESAEVAAYLEPAALRDLAAALAGDPAARRPGWALDAWRALTLECWLRMQRDGLPPDITVLA
jgi:asparagine synthase (glutamine-hydrolysing)